MLSFKSGNSCARLLVAGLVVAAGAVTSAQGAIFVYQAALSGPAESPPNASPGIGFTTVTVDTTASTMRVEASFSGLTGTTTASHIHGATAVAGAGTAGVMTQTPSFSGFPLGVTAGVMDTTFDMTLASSYNPSYITAHGGSPATAMPDLFAAIADGKAYLNIHTSTFGGGEIRGFLVLVPTPGSAALFAVGGLVALRRRRA